MKTLVLGAGGFIGSHLVKRLKERGDYVVGIDVKYPDFSPTVADEFILHDLRDKYDFGKFDEVYQLAADIGGAGYLFTGEHDADVMHNSAMINLNVANYFKDTQTKIFYSSSACIYPLYNQLDKNNPDCREKTAYPANPDSEYGWEKLFSERMYQSYSRNYGLNVRIARFHNIFGPEGTYDGGKEKAPAALCRKIARGGIVEIWGDGEQTRSFLYIDECIDGIFKLMASSCTDVVNIGSEEMISINDLAKMIMKVAGKDLEIKHIDGPLGVNGRNSNNDFIYEKLGWKPSTKLIDGITKTYSWIEKLV